MNQKGPRLGEPASRWRMRIVPIASVMFAAAVPRIVAPLAMIGVDVPNVGDLHYNGHQLLAGEPACAEALAK